MNKQVSHKSEEAKEVSKVVTGYKFALGVGEVLLGLGILTIGNKALSLYNNLKQDELLEDPRDLFVGIIDNSLPYIIQHRLAIVIILLLIGVIKITSCIAIWMGKTWGVHLLLFFMLIALPFDLYDFFQNLFKGHIAFGSIALNAINIWVILSLTRNHPVEYLKKLDWKHLFSKT